MKEAMLASFSQNPNALAELLATGNATLTHTQDKTKWGTEFPRLLMEVRAELSKTAPAAPAKTITLKDGKKYSTDDIDSILLRRLEYTPQEIGKILKQIC